MTEVHGIRVRVRYLGSLSIYIAPEESYVLDRGSTLRDLLRVLLERHRVLERAIDPRGVLRPGYMLFVNERDYQLLGLDSVLEDGSEIVLMPISHGGGL